MMREERRQDIAKLMGLLQEIAKAANEVRHPLQLINPMWKGERLGDVLDRIAYQTLATLLKAEEDFKWDHPK